MPPGATGRYLGCGGGDDPPAGLGGHAGVRPARQGGGEGVLDRLLGEVDVAEVTDQDGHRAPVLVPEHPRDLR